MKRPNILLILADDHGAWSLPAYGHSEMVTPNFDRLSSEGSVFEGAFTPCPVCSPGRTCLMTGRTPSQTGMHDWLEENDKSIGDRDWLKDEFALPQRLQQAGYHTLLAGKWHLGSHGRIPSGFDHAFTLSEGWQGKHNYDDQPYTYGLDGTACPLKGNKSERITDHALQFLDNAPGDQPFFLNIGYIATRAPFEASEHDPARIAEVENFTFRDLPEYRVHPWIKNEGLAKTSAQLRSHFVGYYAAVCEMDLQVGRILDSLETRGLLENTIVIYASDHGCAMGHHGFIGKGNATTPLNMHDVSLRVPLLIRGPKIATGKRISERVDHYDLFEGILEWAQLPAGGADFPGQSLAPLAEGKSPEWNEEKFGEYGDLRMIHNARFKWVKRYPHGPFDLFDLQQDPGETFNLAGWEQYREMQAELDARLSEWYSAHENPEKSGLRVKELPCHNSYEAWRDGRREARGLQVY